MAEKKKGLALPEVSVHNSSHPNPEYELKRESDKYPKQTRYESPINLTTDEQFQHQLVNDIPKSERRERNISPDEIYSPLDNKNFSPKNKDGITAPSLKGGNKN